MSKHPSPRRDFVGMKQRRLKAARLFADGVKPAEVARQLEVSRQSVSRWHQSWEQGGTPSLAGAGRAGRMPMLNAAQIQEVEKALTRGPRANEVKGDLWTLSRVADVIREITSVSYHPGHVWRILRQMGWSAQRPAKRATQRDDEEINGWIKRTWPAVKKTPSGTER